MTPKVVIACVMVLACVAATGAQTTAQPPRTPPPPRRPAAARPPTPPPDPRTPLDRTRSAYLDDQANATNVATLIRSQLRAARLWNLTDRRGDADLIVTLAPARSPASVRSPLRTRSGLTVYELTVRNARSAASTPLWRRTSSTPEKLVGRLKADVAPTACVAIWCW